MNLKKRLLVAHVLKSKLVDLEPPREVTEAVTRWISSMEKSVAGGIVDNVDVDDLANVNLETVRGPKQ